MCKEGVWLGLALLAGVLASPPSCRISELLCDTGQCVALDRFCDGIDDCPDRSDEPPYCTPCNRTFYGEVGRTYELEIRRPREDRLPFLCHLNFTAGGGDFGDLVQLTFDTFTVGKFVSFTSEGCPDGHMSIRESDRPDTEGQWCGSAWGYTVYYSESRSLNLTLLLDKLSEQGIGYNFDFKLAYKFLRRAEAHLRYGNSTSLSYRGELLPGTYCDRVLEGCDRRPCRIQSPNYPGVYPRNVTCYYRVEQRQAPRGKHVLLAVRQRNSHKIHIKDQIVKYDRSQRVLRVWDQCNVVQDYLTVYDGPSTLDPVLVRLCGGDVVPDIVSSGPNMLLEFHTSPYDNPFHPVPLSYLPGFELEVQVLFVESRSHKYVRDGRQCEFLLTSFDSPWGVLENPRHSLPPNTTCRYHFQGRKHETVWLSFVKYHAASADPTAFQLSAECNARLRVWDGRINSQTALQRNVSLLGEFCKDEVPRLCDHTLLSNSSRFTRPCSLAESYVSSGSELTLEQFLRQGSVLFPLNFLIRYEFVDTSLEGNHVKGSENPCDRVFTSTPNSLSSGKFQSPRSVFYYGRGGAQNLSCVMRFEPSQGERVQLTFMRARFGDRKCSTQEDARTGRWKCVKEEDTPAVAELWVSEYPWPGIKLPRDCFCSRASEPVTITSLTSATVEVNFTVTFMNITQDFGDFHFEGEYQFISVPSETISESCSKHREERKLRGSSGEVVLRSPTVSKIELNEIIAARVSEETVSEDKIELNSCANFPWLIEPEDSSNNFLYLKIRGYELTSSRWREDSFQCETMNRILVYNGMGSREPKVVCPTADFGNKGHRVVEAFSYGWNRSSSLTLLTPHARSFVVEFVEREPGSYSVSWMEISKRPHLTTTSSYVMSSSSMDCPYRCPEINACISSDLWCDGVKHCSSGYDEEEVNCALQFGVPLLYVAIGAGSLLVLTLLTIITACLKVRQYRKNRKKKKNAARANNHLHISPHNGDLGKRYPGTPDDLSLRYQPDLYLDGKDSLC